MINLDNLFKFPIIMIDGDKEDEKNEYKRDLNISLEDPELIVGEVMVPHEDFLFIRDRWNLTSDSYEKALSGNFECCIVEFRECGSFIVPWKKEKFLKELNLFRQNLKPENKQDFLIVNIKDLINNDNQPSKGD